ncbi:hypothetical protein BDZ94DRAFT_1272685, partial [Collybia nuda]
MASRGLPYNKYRTCITLWIRYRGVVSCGFLNFIFPVGTNEMSQCWTLDFAMNPSERSEKKRVAL